MTLTYEELERQLEPAGLAARGGFHPEARDALENIEGSPVRTVVMIGLTGHQHWETFTRSPEFRDGRAHPLDRWSTRILDAVARELAGRALYPFQGPPWWPFQRWARRALALHVSPTGVLLDPKFGLWHSYRGALALSWELPLPQPVQWPDPCGSCASKPCLHTCPVGAFQPGSYDVDACRGHVRLKDSGCRSAGCMARRACPVGAEHAYPADQAAFYMRAFAGA